jgi:Putative prokaryotic signal transducing protein
MKELLRTNNPVLVSWITAALDEQGIEVLVFDQNMSIMEGSLGILPRRVMVADEDLPQAKEILRHAPASDPDIPSGD